MTFYLKPEEGTIPLHLINSYAECRLRYLAKLRSYEVTGVPLSPELMQFADCLIEGTPKDRVSHFALRSVSNLHPPLHGYVTHKEILLFKKRLRQMSPPDLRESLKLLIRQLKEYISIEEDEGKKSFLSGTRHALISLVQEKESLVHLSEAKGKEGDKSICQKHQSTFLIGVSFSHVLDHLSKRDIFLKQGYAYFRCDQIPSFLSNVFSLLLDYTSERVRRTSLLQRISEDSRFKTLIDKLQSIYHEVLPMDRGISDSSINQINLRTLDELSNFFPSCMRAIHYTLRTRHRLCHIPRVQYTLFLKSLGLPVQDFLKLLETEYSRPPQQTKDNRHNCEHSWASDKRRYIYGTRHLYGLEGKRTNYSSHGCHSIQRETPGPNSCGGCPFAHFDKENLKNFMKYDLGSDNADAFLKQINHDKILPLEACHLHLRFKSKCLFPAGNASQELRTIENSQVKIHTVFKPKHYFITLSKISVCQSFGSPKKLINISIPETP